MLYKSAQDSINASSARVRGFFYAKNLGDRMNLSEIFNRLFETISLSSSKVVYFFSWLGLIISGLTVEQITGVSLAVISAFSMIVAGIMNYRLKVRLIRLADSNLNNQQAHELFLEQTRD